MMYTIMKTGDFNLFYLLLIGITLPFFIGFIILVFLAAKDSKQLKEKIKGNQQQQQQLLLKFSQHYSVSIPPNVNIEETELENNNYYTLILPHWKYAVKTGLADKRYNSNGVIYEKSTICVDNYVLTSDSIKTILHLVHELRNNGVQFSENPLEEEKRTARKSNNININKHQSLHSIISSFEEHPTEFESFCADLFRHEGYTADVTAATNDGGYDIFLRDPQTNETALVECKCYDFFNKIGRPLLQKLYGANASIQANRLIFITTSDFSKQALDYGHEVDIEMINGKKLLEWVNQTNQDVDTEEPDLPNEEMIELTEDDIIALLPEDLKDKLK